MKKKNCNGTRNLYGINFVHTEFNAQIFENFQTKNKREAGSNSFTFAE